MTGCSVYKSAMRKDFENQVPNSKLNSASVSDVSAKMSQCSTYDPLTAWMLRQFPTTPSQLVAADEGVEIWKQHHADGRTTLKSYSAKPAGVEVCTMDDTENLFPGEETSTSL